MVKDNSLISFVFFVIGLILYSIYLIYDFKNQEGAGWWMREFGFAKREEAEDLNLTALLLGGSNVVYSLSAQQLDKSTNLQWYNFGLSSEAMSDPNYWGYISDTLTSKQRQNIDLIVYSGIQLLSNGYIRQRNLEDSNAWNQRPLGLIPNKPLYEVILNPKTIRVKRYYPLPLKKGDFDFNKMICPQKYKEAFVREENWSEAKSWIENQILAIQSLFTKAKIIFVIPSEFYGETYNLDFDRKFFKKVKLFIKNRFGDQIKVLIQPPYADKKLTCDARQHANENGRYWRTNNLSEFINLTN
tara:strand:- start:225 stop:1124 length:900 start_codon:yes stop_codon:yes gene_type:complete